MKSKEVATISAEEEGNKKGTSWSVVTTCSEPLMLLEGFVAHHLSLGAERVFLFFDDEFDTTQLSLGVVPGVEVINCNGSYWAMRKNGKPHDHRRRQTYNAEFAARKLCRSDWIIHIDADEFLYPLAGKSIADLLTTIPDCIDAARVLPAERMFVDEYVDGQMTFDGVFKLKPKRGQPLGEKLYGNLGHLFPNGFQGHEVGKSFKRVSNLDARFSIHFVRKDGENIPEHKFPQSEAVLLHFFPASYEDWKSKYARRIYNFAYFNGMPDQAKRRYSIYRQILEKDGEAGLRALFGELSIAPSNKISALEGEFDFVRPNLGMPELIRKIIAPHRERSWAFSHVVRDGAIPIGPKVFQIGMNRCGTKGICRQFASRGFSYAHWDNGNLAKDLIQARKEKTSPFKTYESFHLLSDIEVNSAELSYEGFYDVEHILNYFPNAIYVLNHRPVEEWLASRKRLRGGAYLETYQKFWKLSSPEQVLEKWRSDWHSHVSKVRELAAGGGMRLIEWSLNTEKPSVFFKNLQQELIDAGSLN